MFKLALEFFLITLQLHSHAPCTMYECNAIHSEQSECINLTMMGFGSKRGEKMENIFKNNNKH